jgi:hypothetical protein
VAVAQPVEVTTQHAVDEKQKLKKSYAIVTCGTDATHSSGSGSPSSAVRRHASLFGSGLVLVEGLWAAVVCLQAAIV